MSFSSIPVSRWLEKVVSINGNLKIKIHVASIRQYDFKRDVCGAKLLNHTKWMTKNLETIRSRTILTPHRYRKKQRGSIAFATATLFCPHVFFTSTHTISFLLRPNQRGVLTAAVEICTSHTLAPFPRKHPRVPINSKDATAISRNNVDCQIRSCWVEAV